MRIVDYVNQGGVIMYILLFLNIIGFAIMLAKFMILSKEKKKLSPMAISIGDKVKVENSNEEPNVLIELAKQEISNLVHSMEKGLNTIKIIASISPLLGLLGTVLGVLIAFRVMSESGLNNPASFAQGISMALITTVGGLIVAIPHYIGHSYLLGILDSIETKLEKEVLSKIL